jgi:ribonuclease P protein component
VFDARCLAADDRLVVFAMPNGLEHCRLGLSISKKKCPQAVSRNRWKRMVREAFRLHHSEFPCSLDIVAVPQSKGKNGIDLKTPFGNVFTPLVRRIALKTMPTVLITRPPDQTEPLKTALKALGYCVLLQPAIEIKPPDDWQNVDEVIGRLCRSEFDYLVFSSTNGVTSFFDRFAAVTAAGLKCDFDTLNVRIAVVGSGTEAVLYQRVKRQADIVPKTFNAEGLVEAFKLTGTASSRILIITGSRSRSVLKEGLTALGNLVTEISVYQSVDVMQPDAGLVGLMQRGKIRYVTVTSSALGTSLVNMFGENLRNSKLVSISPLTSAVLQNLGFPPQLEAEEASMQGIVRLMTCVRAATSF